MRATIIIEFGWCGFGWSGGLIPDIRAGLMRLAWCRGSLLDRVREWRDALAAMLRSAR